MSAQPLGSVAVVPAGNAWAVILNRPARAEVLRTFENRDQAVHSAGHLAEMLDLPMLAVGAEPDDASGAPSPFPMR